MPQVPIFLRHPEVPAHHTTAIAACTWVRGPRRMAARNCCLLLILHRRGRRPPISGLPEIGSLCAQVGQGRLAMARPAEEAGLAPQGDGESARTRLRYWR